MRKLILMTLCTVLALSVHAQRNGKSADELADKRAAKLKTELGLSDEQHKSVRAAVLEKINSASAVRERYKDSANKKGMGAELKQVNLRFRTTMDAILTANQRAKYKASEDEEEGDDDRSDEKSERKAEQNKNKSDKEQASTDKKQASIDKKQAKVDRQQAKVKRKEAKVKEREERLKAKEERLKEKKEKLEEKDEKLEKKEKKLDQKEEELKK